MRFFILSFIGDDRPGFVHEITEVVSRCEGNWLESRMIRLGGKFAGLARVSAASEQAAVLESELSSLAQGRFSLIIKAAETHASLETKQYTLDILGNDRPGILNEITRALVEHGINLIEVSSSVAPAAMSGVPMFSCSANIEVEPSLSMVVVDEQLSEIADELAIDILLEETPPE